MSCPYCTQVETDLPSEYNGYKPYMETHNNAVLHCQGGSLWRITVKDRMKPLYFRFPVCPVCGSNASRRKGCRLQGTLRHQSGIPAHQH